MSGQSEAYKRKMVQKWNFIASRSILVDQVYWLPCLFNWKFYFTRLAGRITKRKIIIILPSCSVPCKRERRMIPLNGRCGIPFTTRFERIYCIVGPINGNGDEVNFTMIFRLSKYRFNDHDTHLCVSTHFVRRERRCLGVNPEKRNGIRTMANISIYFYFRNSRVAFTSHTISCRYATLLMSRTTHVECKKENAVFFIFCSHWNAMP